jgi:competence protein ComEA
LTTKTLALSIVLFAGMAEPALAQDTLPDGPGKEPLLRVCSQCHEASKSTSVKLTRAGWIETIDKMKALGADGSEQEFQAILEYLATHFKGELDRPLDLNTAEALDLESVLGLLRRESAAFLQYRATRGALSSIEDLKDLDPVILRKIEARKDRTAFLEVKTKK